ncbi:uncharacterized protein F4807DRAFT_458571 [Annulohypoxylon truncatum]|uniref:uncharacterized protein n=1 Tax=Annulohypoxylon truncatum TaxID=327061 RepID=UPI0020075A3D|nr:uncharacterized protein F4807DRAFT_458571 [Annulohypoxylon truncatum]KAI1211676.1 hypothetical protein F4807DRAFT_458571 [Annulohypoxylon truncatum]
MSLATLQIVSDLHLETHKSYKFNIKQTALYLGLLGDIGNVTDDGFFEFIKKQLTRYWTVFLLMGNHEPIGTSWSLAKRRVRAFADQMEQLRAQSTIGRFVFLDQTRYDLNDTVTVLGCTLFSEVSVEQTAAVKSRLVDFRQIQDWKVEDHVEAHKSDLQWLNAQVCDIAKEEPGRQIIVFTHHSPTQDDRAVSPEHRDSPVSSGFATDLSNEDCWKNPSVILWGFGHTHYQCDFTDDLGKRVVANQKGTSQIPCDGFDDGKPFLVGKWSPRKRQD